MNPARQRALDLRRLPRDATLNFDAMTACDCGCDLPARFEFTIRQFTICISDVKQVDALIEEMRVGREKLWGKP